MNSNEINDLTFKSDRLLDCPEILDLERRGVQIAQTTLMDAVRANRGHRPQGQPHWTQSKHQVQPGITLWLASRAPFGVRLHPRDHSLLFFAPYHACGVASLSR